MWTRTDREKDGNNDLPSFEDDHLSSMSYLQHLKGQDSIIHQNQKPIDASSVLRPLLSCKLMMAVGGRHKTVCFESIFANVIINILKVIQGDHIFDHCYVGYGFPKSDVHGNIQGSLTFIPHPCNHTATSNQTTLIWSLICQFHGSHSQPGADTLPWLLLAEHTQVMVIRLHFLHSFTTYSSLQSTTCFFLWITIYFSE